MAARIGEQSRATKETEIKVKVNLDGSGTYNVSTGIGFLDHMMEQLSRHSLIDIDLEAKGDLHIDFHHTTEDTGIVLGEAVREALGDFKGLARYRSATSPLDETCTRPPLDVSQPSYQIWKLALTNPTLLNIESELLSERYQPFAH